MGLNYKTFGSIQSGGGNHWSRSIPFPGGGIQPFKGDFLVVQIASQFGLTTPTPSAIIPTWTDDAGNLWIHLFQNYYSQNTTFNYAGQFAIDVFFCPFANGNQINNFVTDCAIVPDAYDFQSYFSYSDWQMNNQGITVQQSTKILVATATPTLNPFQLLHDQLIINAFWAPAPPGTGITTVTPTTGYSDLNFFDNFYDEWAARPSNLNQNPSIISDVANSIWLGTSVVFNINPPSVIQNQVFFRGLKTLAIEE